MQPELGTTALRGQFFLLSNMNKQKMAWVLKAAMSLRDTQHWCMAGTRHEFFEVDGIKKDFQIAISSLSSFTCYLIGCEKQVK